MRLSAKINRLLQVLLFACAAYFLQACQEFTHDSFDTFQGVIVDEAGNPLANIRLNLYSYGSNYFFTSSSSAKIVSNGAGEFKVVLPSRSYETNFYLVPPANLAFKVEQFGAFVNVRELPIQSLLIDRNRVIDLGRITVVEQ